MWHEPFCGRWPHRFFCALFPVELLVVNGKAIITPQWTLEGISMTTNQSERNQTPPETQALTNSDAFAGEEKAPAAFFPIVGIGASAGGLEAFTQLLKALPLDTGMAFVLVQHLDPDHESALTQILSKTTLMPICDVVNDQSVEPNHVYIIPPDTKLSIANGVLKLQPRPKSRTPYRSIDLFFESLAADRRERSIGVVLSGAATDGTLGLEAIKVVGGITFAQDGTAKFDSMPRSAVAAGCVDLVLSPSDIADEIGKIAKHPYIAGQPLELSTRTQVDLERASAHQVNDMSIQSDESELRNSQDANLEGARGSDGYATILLLLHNHTGMDFSLYKSSTIRRRIARRIAICKRDSLDSYATLLRGNAQELDALYADVLINVTCFFRNAEVFDALQSEVLPKLLQQPGDDPVRVWIPGCSSGQEAYSIAIAFVENSEKLPRGRNLQVFATDLSEESLEKARVGLYPKALSDEISPERLSRFFVEEQGGYRVSKILREKVVFAKQSLFVDPPFSRMDLISCRNLLIYLGPSLQNKAIPTFHYALKPNGFLLLGASESIGSFSELFEPIDKRFKIYTKKAAPTPSFHMPASSNRFQSANRGRRESAPSAGPPHLAESVSFELRAQREADRILIHQFSPPGVLVNGDLQVIQFRGSTGEFLDPPVGKASFDILKMAKQGLMLPLRAAIEESKKENKTTRRESVRMNHNGETRAVNLEVIPLENLSDACYLVLFEDPKSVAQVLPREKPAKHSYSAKEETSLIHELESELSDSRQYIRILQEQYDSTTEELQAASDEVQSANEELQSINEELETSKEELESANEELTTVNDELSHRNFELNVLNNDLVNFQNSAKIVVLLLGRDLTIRRFSPQAEKQFDLIATDIGRPISHIVHDLVQSDNAKTPLNLESICVEVINTASELESEVLDSAGRWYSIRARPYITLDKRVDGAVMLMIEINELKQSEQAAAAARDYAENTVETVRVPLLVLNANLCVESANRSFYRVFRAEPSETVGTFIYDLGNHQWDIPKLRELLEEILPHNTSIEAFQVEHDFDNLGRRIMLLDARRVLDPQKKTKQILLAIEDITDRKQLEQRLNASETLYRRLFETAKDGVLILDAETGKILEANPFMTELSGFPVEEFLGKELWEIGLFRDQAANEATFKELQQKGFVRYDHLPLKSAYEQQVEVEFVSNVYEWDHRRVAQCNIRDIGVRKGLERQTQKQAAELSDLHRRKDEFLAMLSHELRSPLAPIANAVGLLSLQKGSENLIQQQARNIIERQMKHMQRLVDDLLEVSRITTGRVQLRRERVVVSRIVEGAVETARPLIEERRHQLSVSIPPEPIWLNADVSRLEQVLVNLLTNAAKYTGDGGRIWVTVQQEGELCVLRVRDNGVGISKELLPRIFDLFTQAERSLDRSQGGLGIGLALVQRLTNLHGGTVMAESALGQGSEFIVRLPVLLTDGLPTKQATVESNQLPARSLRVLVVDDNVDTVLSFSMLLRASGHDVHTAHDGMEAVEAALEYKPDVVLLDIGLPVLNGYEVARRIRLEPTLKYVVLIALTGYGQEADRQTALQAGFDHHLVKPARLEQLQKILSTVAIRSE